MDIEMVLLGYKCRADHIISRPAFLPWYPDDELMVIVEFEVPYPASIISTGIRIPAKEYSSAEFLEVLKTEGEKQLQTSIAKHKDSQMETEVRDNKSAELKALAQGIESKFG